MPLDVSTNGDGSDAPNSNEDDHNKHGLAANPSSCKDYPGRNSGSLRWDR